MFSSKVTAAIATGLAFIGWGSFELIRVRAQGISAFDVSGWAMVGIGVAIVAIAALIGALVRPRGVAVSPSEFVGQIIASAPWLVGTWFVVNGIALYREIEIRAPSTGSPRLQAVVDDSRAGMLLLPQVFIGLGLFAIVGNLIWGYVQRHRKSGWYVPVRGDDYF